MPLRRFVSVLGLGVCLLGLPAASTPPPPANAGQVLLRDAQPFLADAARLPWADARENTELYHLRFERVFPSGLSGIVEQRVFEIPNAAAADLFVPDDVWYDSARTRFQLVRAQVLRRGRSLPGRDGGDLRPGATGNQPRHLLLPRLQAGDRVDLVYELLPDTSHDWSLLQGHFLGNLFAFADSYPTVRSRYVLAAAPSRPQAVTVAQVGVGPAERGRAADGDATWAWDAHDLPAYFGSPDGPSITDRSPFVQVSGFRGWAEMADWYDGVLRERARLSPELRQQMLGLRGATTRATVARVWQYLSQHLEYVGVESGIHAYVPAPVGAVFAAGRGDCKDGALLLATWLRALGIEADLALVRTPAMGRLAAADTADVPATMAAFDHALVYVPATGQWIDTTAPQFLTTELPASDQNGLALIVRPGQSALVGIPSAAPGANLTRRSVRLTMDGAWMHASGDISVRGADAPALRQEYANPAERTRALQDWLATYFPDVRVESVAVAGVAPASDQVDVHFTARMPAQPRTVAWLRRHYTRLLAAEQNRQQALELPLRWELDESWSLPLEAGTPCPESAPLSDVSAYGRLNVVASCGDGRVRFDSQVVQNARVVAAANYAAFRGFWQRVDAVLNADALPAPAAAQVASANR